MAVRHSRGPCGDGQLAALLDGFEQVEQGEVELALGIAKSPHRAQVDIERRHAPMVTKFFTILACRETPCERA